MEVNPRGVAMEAVQATENKHTDYHRYLIVEQRRKALETYKAIKKKIADKKDTGKRIQLLLPLEGV
jgi:hypothetical protein